MTVPIRLDNLANPGHELSLLALAEAKRDEDFQTSPQTPLGHMIHCYTL